MGLFQSIKNKLKGKKGVETALEGGKTAATKVIDVGASKVGVSAESAAKGKEAVVTQVDKLKAELA